MKTLKGHNIGAESGHSPFSPDVRFQSGHGSPYCNPSRNMSYCAGWRTDSRPHSLVLIPGASMSTSYLADLIGYIFSIYFKKKAKPIELQT